MMAPIHSHQLPAIFFQFLLSDHGQALLKTDHGQAQLISLFINLIMGMIMDRHSSGSTVCSAVNLATLPLANGHHGYDNPVILDLIHQTISGAT